MQASQNTAQVFLGVNLKCNSCHDSFVSKWKLKDAYALAAYFSPEPKLQLYRCDVAQEQLRRAGVPLSRADRAPPRRDSLADRRAAAAAIFTDPRNGRLPRTLVNRIWQRLLGRGIVANPDEMDGQPWSPELLDWLASDFVEHGYDLKRLIATIVTSRAYQMPRCRARRSRPRATTCSPGPEVRRLTAEQFADAVGAITGEWRRGSAGAPAAAETALPGGAAGTAASQSRRRAGSTRANGASPRATLTRALGRPIRDQVHVGRGRRSDDAAGAGTGQRRDADTHGCRAARGGCSANCRPSRPACYNRAVAGRVADVQQRSTSTSRTRARLWLVVQDERVERRRDGAAGLGAGGARRAVGDRAARRR